MMMQSVQKSLKQKKFQACCLKYLGHFQMIDVLKIWRDFFQSHKPKPANMATILCRVLNQL